MNKLIWLNAEYLKEAPEDRFFTGCLAALKRADINADAFPREYVKAALETCKGKLKQFSELPEYAGFYFQDDFNYDPEAVAKDFTAENKPRLLALREALVKLPHFEADPIGATIAEVAKGSGVKTGVLVHPTRLACCGRTAGPSLYHLMAVLGREKTLSRIDRALANWPRQGN
jgi:glutamyl/glutaminyl-tRNA synthetase